MNMVCAQMLSAAPAAAFPVHPLAVLRQERTGTSDDGQKMSCHNRLSPEPHILRAPCKKVSHCTDLFSRKAARCFHDRSFIEGKALRERRSGTAPQLEGCAPPGAARKLPAAQHIYGDVEYHGGLVSREGSGFGEA